MNINSYNYLNLNTNSAAYTNKTPESTDKKGVQINETPSKNKDIDSVSLSPINAADYLKNKYSNLNYNVLNPAEAFPDWYSNGVNNGFPLQELYVAGVTEVSGATYDINAVPDNTHAVFIPPALQEKMDENPELAMQVIKKIEEFMQAQQFFGNNAELTEMGMTITSTSSILSFDENGDIATWNIVVDFELEIPEGVDSFEINIQTASARIEATDEAGNRITYKSFSASIAISSSRYEGLQQLEENLVLTFKGALIDLNTGKLIQPAASEDQHAEEYVLGIDE